MNYKTATKRDIITHSTEIEAGYVDHPDDLGGETNHGITFAVANRADIKRILVNSFGWDGSMRNLTTEMAYFIYELEYWTKLRLDTVHAFSPALAAVMFDVGINAGTTRAGEYLQSMLNACSMKETVYKTLVVDGIIGPASLNALVALGKKRGSITGTMLAMGIVCLVFGHYTEIANKRVGNQSFTWGWYNRAMSNLRGVMTS